MRTFNRIVVEPWHLPAAIAGVLIALLAAACGGTEGRQPPRKILLITVDTLRADAVGAYGNPRAETPGMDRLAAAGTRFERAHAQNVVTLPSHANILSGRNPTAHGVHENAGFRFPSDTDTIATLLKAHGYQTAAFVSAFPLDSRFGLTRGFDVYDDRYGKSETHTAFTMQERPGAETVARASAWIAEQDRAGHAWFCWVHVYEPHFPYAPPEPFASRHPGNPYEGEVATADSALEPLIAPMLRTTDGAALVILTGDHGESLGEHGEMTHGLFAYEATLHVPLILYYGGVLRPGVVSEPVRHVDILPTILDAARIEPPSRLDGKSLLPLAQTVSRGIVGFVARGFSRASPRRVIGNVARGFSRASARPSYFESLSASLNRGWAPLYGVVTGNLKYIDLPIPELYDLDADPAETRNLANADPARVRELQQVLAAMRVDERLTPRGVETAETRERLKSLGYTTGSPEPKSHYTEADDPKRLIALDRRIEDVVSRYQRGDLRGALALAQEVVRERPNMPLALVHLAFLHAEAGEHRAAADAILQALALNPRADDIAALAGAYLNEAGQPQRALAVLQPYASADPPDVDVVVAQGVALAAEGRQRDALAAFERARGVDPSNATPLVNMATVYLMQNDPDRAEPLFEEALKLDPSAARAHNALGVIAAERGDPNSAIDHWKKAVAIDPRNAETLFNLGDLLSREGRTAEARHFWLLYVQNAPPDDVKDTLRVRKWLDSHPASRP